MKHYPYVPNSDFHKPKHLYSWKTLVRAEKNWLDLHVHTHHSGNTTIYPRSLIHAGVVQLTRSDLDEYLTQTQHVDMCSD